MAVPQNLPDCLQSRVAVVIAAIVRLLALSGSKQIDRFEGSPMEFTDKLLKCSDCDETFLFSADEQVFFHDKQFVHEPKRCKSCRAKRSEERPRRRVECPATCAACGRATTVPFKPTKGLPIMCRSCFQKIGSAVPPDAPAEAAL
jgi:CxxC-x17-CxxC domain-containing protein